jgi:hypothetical protein
MFGIFFVPNYNFIQHKTSFPENLLSTHVLNLFSKTLALDCENNKDVSDDIEEQYYEEPDHSRGLEGVDYGIVYGTSNEELDTEA